jgi:transcriptional regulator with XRE-family HTH domain
MDIARQWKHPARPPRYVGAMSVKRPATRDTLAINLTMLMAEARWNQVELAKRSGVSQRQISNILRKESGCSVEHADALAKAFGLQGWHLIMPSLPADVRNGAIPALLQRYAAATAEGRKAIDRVAELESRFSKTRD